MKIAIINANSKIGKHLVDEALARDMDVTVFTSIPNETKATQAIQKENMDITADDLKGFDAVIDAAGVWDSEHVAKHYHTLFHLCDCLSGTETRLLIVGGDGANYSAKELENWFDNVQTNEHGNKQQKISTKWFGRALDMAPSIAEYAGQLQDVLGDEYINMDTVFADLKRRKDVNWIFMDPSCEISTSLMDVTIPYTDYAKDMLDEVQYGVHYQQRVGTTCN